MSDAARDYANASGAPTMIYPAPRTETPSIAILKTLFAGLFGAQRWPSMN